MVQLNSSFAQDGPPFSGWRMGWGFGKRCRSYIQDPQVILQGRESPWGEGYYRESRFWRGKWETDQVSSFGCGERPDYGNDPSTKGKPGPNAYGDVSKKLGAIAKNTIYTEMKIKPRFLSVEQRNAADPRCSGPGPAKYDTRIPAGESGLSRGSKNPKWHIAKRYLDNAKLNEEEGKPGPGHYVTRGKAGRNYPTKHGTLYDIVIGTRFPSQDFRTQKGPGPGAYRVKGIFDEY